MNLEKQKSIWTQRKNYLSLMLHITNEAVAANDLFSKIDESHAAELIAKEELRYTECMIHLRGCHDRKIESNAKDLGEIKIEN